MKMSIRLSETGEEEKVPMFMVAIGVPLMFSSTFEVPLDRATFTSRHSLDMNFLSCDERFVGVTSYADSVFFAYDCCMQLFLACAAQNQLAL